jgi:hypothetical protein
MLKVLTNIFKSRVFYSSPSLLSTNKININLENTIKFSTLNNTAGVNILYAPTNFGKTISTINVLKELYFEKKIDNCIILDCSTFKNKLSEEIRINVWNIMNSKNNNSYAYFTLSKLFSEKNIRSVLVLDHLEKLYEKNYSEFEIKNMLSCMAHDAVLNNTYIVQVNINDNQKYEELLKINNGQKISKVLY